MLTSHPKGMKSFSLGLERSDYPRSTSNKYNPKGGLYSAWPATPSAFSRLPAKRAIIIQIHQVEPSVNILAQRVELFHLIRKFNQRLGITVRRAAQMKLAPRGDFPRLTLMLRVLLNPRKDFQITAAFGEFRFQGLVIKAGEVEKMPVHALADIVIFTKLAGQGRTPLVENARQQDITTQPQARAARCVPGQIGSRVIHAHKISSC